MAFPKGEQRKGQTIPAKQDRCNRGRLPTREINLLKKGTLLENRKDRFQGQGQEIERGGYQGRRLERLELSLSLSLLGLFSTIALTFSLADLHNFGFWITQRIQFYGASICCG